MALQGYVDFDVTIEDEGDGVFEVRARSEVFESTTTFHSPFEPLELENLFLRLRTSRAVVRGQGDTDTTSIQAFGTRLYDTVFTGDVRTAFRMSLDHATTTDRGLRIRLRLKKAGELAVLPWEYLYSESLGRYLVLSTKTPIVRYLDLPLTVEPLTVEPPLKILVVISSPSDLARLDVEGEWALLSNALQGLVDSGYATIERLDDARLSTLRHKLRTNEYHVLHFIGHGGVHNATGESVLYLESDTGEAKPEEGRDLALVLREYSNSLRLVMLNACEAGRTVGDDAFDGVAQSLIRQGIPAVMAMQFAITDTAAVAFAQEFYSAIADGLPVDAAAASARLGVYLDVSAVEWGTPVLYIRAPDGRIFAKAPAQDPPDPAPLPEPEPPIRPREDLYATALRHVDEGELTLALAALDRLLLSPDGTPQAERLREDIENRLRADHLYATARAAQAAGNLDGAADALDELLSIDPAYPDPHELAVWVAEQRTMARQRAEADQRAQDERRTEAEPRAGNQPPESVALADVDVAPRPAPSVERNPSPPPNPRRFARAMPGGLVVVAVLLLLLWSPWDGGGDGDDPGGGIERATTGEWSATIILDGSQTSDLITEEITALTVLGDRLVAVGRTMDGSDEIATVWARTAGGGWQTIRVSGSGTGQSHQFWDVRAGSSGVVAVGRISRSGDRDGLIAHSVDGVTWTVITDGPGMATDEQDQFVRTVEPLPGGGFIAAGWDAAVDGVEDLMVWLSDDGLTWTLATRASAITSAAEFAQDIGVGDGVIVVVGRAGGSLGSSARAVPAFWYSDDGGSSWNLADAPATGNGSVTEVLWDGDRFVAAGSIRTDAGARPAMWESSDGRSWTTVPAPDAEHTAIQALILTDAGLIAAGPHGEASNGLDLVMWVSDGDTWQQVAGVPGGEWLNRQGAQNVRDAVVLDGDLYLAGFADSSFGDVDEKNDAVIWRFDL